jgi:hypothetical protein
MQPNQIPQTGADFSCSNLWQIYILRGGVQWCPVGLLRDRALAETHLANLRKMMRHNQFQLVWVGGDRGQSNQAVNTAKSICLS